MSLARDRRRLEGAPRLEQQLVLLGRWPAPGRCKRRLAVDLGGWRAAAVQRALLLHGLAAARAAARQAQREGHGIEVLLALGGCGPRTARRLQRLLPRERLVGQGEGSLGLRLHRQVERARREGIRRLVLIGTDLPHLDAPDLLSAFAALRASPVVLGPANDGGYWLMGLWPQRRAPRLFAGSRSPIPWGSERVLASTLEAARAEGLTPALLAERRDIDRPVDLMAWR